MEISLGHLVSKVGWLLRVLVDASLFGEPRKTHFDILLLKFEIGQRLDSQQVWLGKATLILNLERGHVARHLLLAKF